MRKRLALYSGIAVLSVAILGELTVVPKLLEATFNMAICGDPRATTFNWDEFSSEGEWIEGGLGCHTFERGSFIPEGEPARPEDFPPTPEWLRRLFVRGFLKE